MQATPAFTTPQKRVLLLSSLGGVLEFYDFIIYIFLAPYIEKVFFANNSSYVASLKTLAIFSIGYLLRPLGGVIFAHFGDRYGRKVVFLLTVVLMAVPSFAIGLLPTTAEVGMAAPIMLLVCRMMQGLALGGEIPAAITFVSEHIPVKRRGIAIATLFFGINLGMLLGSLITTIMTTLLTTAEVLDYGWRIPFIIGGFFGIAAIYLRQYLHETAAFRALRQQDVQKIPLVSLLRDSWLRVIQGVLLVSLGAISVFFYLYWPQYLHQYLHYDYGQLMRVNTTGTMILNGSILIGGLLGDRFGFRRVYLITAMVLLTFTYPLFILFNLNSMFWVFISFSILSVIFGMIPSAYSAILCELFPTEVRYSGIALCYNLAYALFGGLSPIICTIAINVFDSVLAPALYIMAVTLVAGVTCILGRRTQTYAQAEINLSEYAETLA